MTSPALKLVPRWTVKPNVWCVLLGRVSTTDQAKPDKTSLEQQEKECRAFALKLAATYRFTEQQIDLKEDPGVSGLNEDRLREIVAALPARPTDQPGLIVVYDSSRFTRLGTQKLFRYMDELQDKGWILDCVTSPRTGNSMTDAFTWTAGAEVAAEHSRMLKRKVLPGMKARFERGLWVSRAPYGFALDATAGTLVPGDADEVKTVRLAFRRADAGSADRVILEELSRTGAPGPQHTRGQRGQWQLGFLRGLLRNRAYVGDTEWNGHLKAGTHDGIIDRALFDRVQARIGKRHCPRQRGDARYLLSGLLTCTVCGGPVVGGGGAPKDVPNPEAYRRYRCYNGVVYGRTGCAGELFTINKVWLETEILGRIAAQVEKLRPSIGRALDRVLTERATGKDPRAALEQERGVLQAKQARMLDAVADGTVSKAQAREKLAELEQQLAAVERQVQAVRPKPTRADVKAERERLLQLADFGTVLKGASPTVARELLDAWLDGPVQLDKDRRTLRLALRPLPATFYTTEPSAIHTTTSVAI
jgi:DNA invertase Pin-like site-specific DNA recombinase